MSETQYVAGETCYRPEPSKCYYSPCKQIGKCVKDIPNYDPRKPVEEYKEKKMNPLSPEKILRNLDHGYTMTHQEQAEAAEYIRQLQQEIEALSVTKFHLESDLEKTQDLLSECLVTEAFRQRGEK